MLEKYNSWNQKEPDCYLILFKILLMHNINIMENTNLEGMTHNTQDC